MSWLQNEALCRRAALDGARRRPQSRPYRYAYERSLRPCLAPTIAPRRRGHTLKPALRIAALVLFFGYAATLVLAGAEGALVARFAFPGDADADLASTYRFLRALELCFGVVALAYWRRIFGERMPNVIFLSAMAAGVAARLLGLAVDGRPGLLVLGVIVWELAGVVVIFLATRSVR